MLHKRHSIIVVVLLVLLCSSLGAARQIAVAPFTSHVQNQQFDPFPYLDQLSHYVYRGLEQEPGVRAIDPWTLQWYAEHVPRAFTFRYEGATAEGARRESADLLLLGRLHMVDASTTTHISIDGLRFSTHRVRLEMYMRVVDPYTMEELATEWLISAGYGASLTLFELRDPQFDSPTFRRSSWNQALEEMADSILYWLESLDLYTSQRSFVEGTVVDVGRRYVFIDRGHNDGLRAGDRLTVYEPAWDRQQQTTYFVAQGVLRILDVDAVTATAELIDGKVARDWVVRYFE